MLRGLYTSGIGMQAQMNRMDVLSNNLANADTTGFKRDLTVTRSFTDEVMFRVNGHTAGPLPHQGLAGRHRPIGLSTSGIFVDEVFTDFSGGRLRAVHDPLAMAIQGSGFFTVDVTLTTGEVVTRYTRDGNFAMNAAGMLVTREGGMVMGVDGGPIFMPMGAGDIVFAPNGEIVVGGAVVGQLAIVDFEDLTTLRKVGNNNFDITDLTVAIPFTGSIIQGYVEDSNINVVREMIEIINTSRIYEANARFVQTMDQTLARAVNDIARRG